MTGKELREWAATLNDGAVIQLNKDYSHDNWEELDSNKLRALTDSRPKRATESVFVPDEPST